MPVKRKQTNYIIIVLTILIYAFLYIHDGAVWRADTTGYQNMILSREPGYSLLIRIFLVVFGEQFFAPVLVFCQMLLACVTTCILTFTVDSIWKLEAFSVYIIWGIQVVFLLLCRLGSGSSAIYPSTVLTEGVTYSLYFLYFKAVLQLNREMSKKRLAEVMLYCILMMLVRTQLIITFLGPVALWFLKAVFKHISWKKWLLVMGSCLAGIVFVIGMDKLYTQILYGVPAGVVGSNSFFFVSGIYGAQETDVELFEDAEERLIFTDIYTLCQAQKSNAQYAEDGFLGEINYYSNNFDIIKFTVTNTYMQQYYQEQGVKDPIEREILIDRTLKKIGVPLFWDNIMVKVRVSAQDMARSMMRTVAKASPILIPYVILAYGSYLFLEFKLFRKRGMHITAWGGLFVLLMMLGNALAISLLIFGEPRYLLYNMVPFYIMGYLMFIEIIQKKKGVQSNDGGVVSAHME